MEQENVKQTAPIKNPDGWGADTEFAAEPDVGSIEKKETAKPKDKKNM